MSLRFLPVFPISGVASMTFCSCPAPGGCDTTFKAIYLGDVHSDQYIDRYEILPGSESAYKLN